MIYRTADDCGLWLRLIHASKNMDRLLASTLEEMLQAGAVASLEPKQRLIQQGTMDAATYEQKRQQVLLPRSAKLMTLVSQVKNQTHPWAQSLQAAYKDLNERCQRGHNAMVDAGRDAANESLPQEKRTAAAKRWRDLLPLCLTRHRQAQSLASALLNAGYARFYDASSTHTGHVVDLYSECRKIGVAVPVDGVSWPVQTPDGWLWVIDVPNTAPQEIDLGPPHGKKMPLEGEPVLLDYELGGAMATLEPQAKEAS